MRKSGIDFPFKMSLFLLINEVSYRLIELIKMEMRFVSPHGKHQIRLRRSFL